MRLVIGTLFVENNMTGIAMTANVFVRGLTGFIPSLHAYGRSLCHNAMWVDDLVQETMLNAWKHRDQLQDAGDIPHLPNLKAWLFTILRNRYYSELRHRKFEVEDPNGFQAAQLAVEPRHDVDLDFEIVIRALYALPAQQRKPLLLICVGGLSYEQAAQRCGCTLGTVKSRIARGRQRLLRLLESRDPASDAPATETLSNIFPKVPSSALNTATCL